ncbi:xylanase A [Hyaloscypha finlandica]|nr:xylanase A [Hyaloscypha finlandica]
MHELIMILIEHTLQRELFLIPRSGTASSEGTSGGYFCSIWTDGNSDVAYLNGAEGRYSISWGGDGDFVGGKGWSTGSTHTLLTGDSYLSVYGWFTSPLAEYYIVESWWGYDSSSTRTYKGTVTSDNLVYDIYINVRTDASSIEGTARFNQYWSIRQATRTSYTVTTSNHFSAWENLGLESGTFNYQIVAVEAFNQGSRSTAVTVS